MDMTDNSTEVAASESGVSATQDLNNNVSEPMGELDMDAAVSRLLAAEDEDAKVLDPSETDVFGDEQPAEAAAEDGEGDDEHDGEDAETEGDDEVETEGEEEADGEDEGDDPDEDDQDGETDVYDIDRLSGDVKLRLADGTEMDMAWLKGNIDKVRRVDEVQGELRGHVQQFQNEVQTHQKRVAAFENVSEIAVEALKAMIPEIPERPSLETRQTDPIGYQEAIDDIERAKEVRANVISRIQAITQQREEQQQTQVLEARKAQVTRIRKEVEYHRGELIKHFPEMKDPAKAKALKDNLKSFAKESLGYSDQELDFKYDSRFWIGVNAAKELAAIKAKPARAVARNKVTASNKQTGKLATGKAGGRKTKEQARANSKSNVRRQIKQSGGIGSLEAAASMLMQLED
jgi:hypothetical protein